MIKVYIAGPDIFKKDISKWIEKVNSECLALKICPLIPFDIDATTEHGVFQNNLKLIEQADVIAANVNCFRGSEPDSGTAWEIGYAYALKKKIFMYTSDPRTVRQKALNHFNLQANSDAEVLPDGMVMEDFGCNTNLMLDQSGRTIVGTLSEVLRLISYEYIVRGIIS